MNSVAIRWIVLLGIISILGIVGAQSFWVIKIWNAEERKLNQQIFVALKNVADKLAAHNHSMPPADQPVKQLTSDYYVVQVSEVIDANVLEHYLKSALVNADIMADFEYAIYDCRSDNLVYGNRVSILNAEIRESRDLILPTYNQYTYYFGVFFPDKSSYVFSEMDTWFILSAVLLLVLLFFGYTLMVILRQKRWSELQKDFINNMTHEFKTPIATINVAADVLRSPGIGQQTERLENYARIIKDQGIRLNGQVEKVLQLAKLEQKALQLHPEPIDLHRELEKIKESFLTHYEDKVMIETQFQERPCFIMADQVHISNVIHNLLDNAIKYSPQPAHITLRTSLKTSLKTSQRDSCIDVSIEDQGRGIPPDYLSRIFYKFVRVPTGNQHDVKGFGLGLYYVHRICKLHRWKITVHSELNRGSRFTISMPCI
ncbi:MAG: HAMP domain-containing sensor histidine kinase [Cyclobacteriaceae bacterium]